MPAATILVVDDNAPALKATVRILQQAGYEVVTAADGAEALRQCRAHRPNLVLLDVMLPDIPGLEVLRLIRSDPNLAAAGVVMLSALQIKPEQQAVGLDAGADGYLTRPITNTELLARVRAILRQRELTDAVRKSEALHRVLFDASPQPMWMYDPETLRFVAVNNAAVAHYGYSREEFLGMTIHDIRPAEEIPALRKAMVDLPEGGHKAGVWRHRLKDGQIVLMEITTYSLDYAGQRVCMVITNDITERKQAEAALRESEERFRSLLQHVPSVAIQGYALDGTVQYWNDASERFYGYSREEAIGGNLLDLIIPSEMRDGVREALRGVAEEGRSIPNEEFSLMRKDGSRILVFSSHAVVRREGHPPELFCIDIDLTGRDRAEAERRRLINNLRERVKELRALHRTAELLRGDGLTTMELLAKVAMLIPPAMQHAEVAAVRVSFGEVEQCTPGFHITPWLLDTGFTASDGTAGGVQIVYLEERPPLDEGPFHAEERSLINSLGEMLRSHFDRVDAVRALRELQRRQQLILESVGEGIHGLDINGNIVFENPAGVAMLGWAESEMLGRHSHTVIHHHHTDGREYLVEDCPIYRTLRDGVVRRVDQEVFFRRDGSSFPVEYVCSPVRDEAGVITGVVVSFRDITERRSIADRLAEQATLLDKAQDAILVRGLDHRILYWNRSAERLYGWTTQEAVGRSVRELLYRDTALFDQATETTMGKGEWVGEVEQYTKAGDKISVEGHWTLVRDDRGNPKSILAIDTDITERKKLEQQFLRAQRMESIGTLAGGIAHDLNNMLAPIMMGVGLLRQTGSGGEAEPILANIERSARRGAELVKQVLSFARGVEGARVTIQPGHIVREVESLVQNTFPKNITFVLKLPPDIWSVQGDPTQLNQVLMNLCVNARDAMPGGGRLTVSAANVEIDEQYGVMNRGIASGRYVALEVSDEGCGMPQEVMDRVFEPFFTTKEVGKGTGLGLSTALGIVRSHGGFVNVYSEIGRGSVFKVYLPSLSDSAAETDETPAESLLRGKGELIMVVDDEITILGITRQTLEAFGYRVITAEDGAQAIGVYALHRDEIALVLTDMMMPVMDGPALVKALRRINPRVRIIAASGINAGGYTGRATAAGVRHFLAKPYSAEVMLTMIRKVLTESLSRPPF